MTQYKKCLLTGAFASTLLLGACDHSEHDEPKSAEEVQNNTESESIEDSAEEAQENTEDDSTEEE
ncbi:hypothetical protein [Macrococcus carouselicus]|uniref:Lipoprotein n=1 Tax=Macrococcus carouselicus TaxID=69969 RepID=A0A9Q8FRC0_9STAP|nr:hypothetical protein [Macrococcus carouselicus]TDM04627.1 hypothetical protein ERX40_05500 [Macrococcus carouselicus]